MQPNDFIEANRKMWNETADIHAQVRGSKLFERVKAPDRELARRKPQGFSPGGPVRPAPWLGRRAFPRLPVPEARAGLG